MEPHTVIFLGAGASCAEGAPAQGELFRKYFLLGDHQLQEGIDLAPTGATHPWDEELVRFFHDFYGIAVQDRHFCETARFPTFEEVLGILELANSQGETFQDWGPSHADGSDRVKRLSHIHEVLVFLIAEVLQRTLQDTGRHHATLVEQFKNCSLLERTAFISLNYDILIDNALLKARDDDDLNLDLDYSIDFMNFGEGWATPRRPNSLLNYPLGLVR